MKQVRLFLIAMGLPALLLCYIVWTIWFEQTYERVPTDSDEQYFITTYTSRVLVVYYSLISAYICISLL